MDYSKLLSNSVIRLSIKTALLIAVLVMMSDKWFAVGLGALAVLLQFTFFISLFTSIRAERGNK